MEPLYSELIRLVVQYLLLLAVLLIAIRCYFRIRKQQAPEVESGLSAHVPGDPSLFPLKLQACERLVLFLERITPQNLILRVHTSDMTSPQLQAALIRTVREEFEYNLSQQLYTSANTWELVRSAKEETIGMINRAAVHLKGNGTARDLAGALLQLALGQEISPISTAIDAVKQEIK